MLAEARPTANVVDELVLGGIPRVESPLFDSTSHEVPLTPEERRIAQSLREDGFAIIDFPDPEFELRSERLK